MDQDNLKHKFHKTLRWYHGFLMALPIASGIFISVGYMIGAIGTLPAALICVVLTLVALLQNKLFSEMITMYPDKAGGIAAIAGEAWKPYFAPLAPIIAFGYWCGWSLVLSLVGLTMGSLIQAQWFPESNWILFTLGSVAFGLPHLISALAIVACTVLNIAGVQVAVKFNQVVSVAFIAVLLAAGIGPFATGQWSWEGLTWRTDVSWSTFVVWMYISAWAIYGSELCAIFAPEYIDTNRDTPKALNSIALFMVGAYTIVPVACAGVVGEDGVIANPITYCVLAIQHFSSGLSGGVTAILCGALFLSMVSSSADAGRALYGISAQGMSLKQLDSLNRKGVPGRAIWITMVVNLLVLVLVGNPVAILTASNLGYILAITLSACGFILLRKDRPDAMRPIRLGRVWLPIAFCTVAFNAFILSVGILHPELSYAGTWKEVLLGFFLLGFGAVLYFYRKLVQEKTKIEWRSESLG